MMSSNCNVKTKNVSAVIGHDKLITTDICIVEIRRQSEQMHFGMVVHN